MSITDFLNARIAEDEEQAEMCRKLGWFPGSKYEMHAVSHARVLAECAAKRAIVEMHQPMKDDGWVSGESHGYLWCSSCGSVDYDSPVPYPCDTIRTLAAVYADHDEYQDEWRVGA